MGRTHLAVALGIAAAKNRNITYFISYLDLITQLNKTLAKNRLEVVYDILKIPQILIENSPRGNNIIPL